MADDQMAYIDCLPSTVFTPATPSEPADQIIISAMQQMLRFLGQALSRLYEMPARAEDVKVSAVIVIPSEEVPLNGFCPPWLLSSTCLHSPLCSRWPGSG